MAQKFPIWFRDIAQTPRSKRPKVPIRIYGIRQQHAPTTIPKKPKRFGLPRGFK